ncbi:MAG: flagellar hook-basal body complex protein FliE [Roseiarcus sp.]
MAVNVTDAVAAYSNAGKVSLGSGLAARDGASGGGFADLLRQTGDGAVDSLRKGEETSLKGIAGKADLAEVAAAVSNAEVTLKTVVAVRDRVIQAYQDIIKMTI